MKVTVSAAVTCKFTSKRSVANLISRGFNADQHFKQIVTDPLQSSLIIHN